MLPPGHEPPDDLDAPGPPDAAGESSFLARTLVGRLPCIGCRYDLQGLSVRGPCPECGMAVRATILYSVDPKADAFQPLATPRLTGLAVVVWPAAGLATVLLSWVPRVEDLVSFVAPAYSYRAGWAPNVGAAAAAVSAIAAAAGLVRISGRAPSRCAWCAVAGVACYIPLIASYLLIAHRVDPRLAAPFLTGDPDPERIALRLVLSLSFLGILMGLRPNARILVARSLVLRTGRVDRQTILATAAAIVLTIVGDVLRFASLGAGRSGAEFLRGLGAVLVLVGSLLITYAVLQAVIDAVRIRRAILFPSPSLEQVLGER